MARLRPSSEIAAEIKRIRQEGYSNQGAFADALGTSQPRLSAWENADDDYVFDLATLERIAKAGGVPMAVFYVEEPSEAKPLTAQDVARLRDEVRSLRDQAEGVLATLEEALNGKPKKGGRVPKREAAPVVPGTARERLGKKQKRA